MRLWIACFVFSFACCTPAHSDTLARRAKSGQPTKMVVYHSWKPRDCSEKFGVVKVVTKPQHGKLTPSQVVDTVTISRLNPSSPCIGTRQRGFRVDYTSDPGYRGVDSFVLEVTFGRRRPLTPTVSDTYTVNVE
jgi:hypothetical protein